MVKSKSKSRRAPPKVAVAPPPPLPGPVDNADDDALVDTPKAAELLGVSHQWLELGRCAGYGPPYVKLTKRLVKYRRSDLREYARKRMVVLEKA
jgi:hypothetical protein